IAGHPAADFSEDEVVAGFAANTEQPLQGIQLEQYDEGAADLAAEAVATHLSHVLRGQPEGGAPGVDQFIQTFGKRAFRRPVAPDELDRYRAAFQKEQLAADFKSAVELIVRAMLESPYFLYRVETGAPSAMPDADGSVPLSGYEVASR